MRGIFVKTLACAACLLFLARPVLADMTTSQRQDVSTSSGESTERQELEEMAQTMIDPTTGETIRNVHPSSLRMAEEIRKQKQAANQKAVEEGKAPVFLTGKATGVIGGARAASNDDPIGNQITAIGDSVLREMPYNYASVTVYAENPTVPNTHNNLQFNARVVPDDALETDLSGSNGGKANYYVEVFQPNSTSEIRAAIRDLADAYTKHKMKPWTNLTLVVDYDGTLNIKLDYTPL